MTSRHSNDEIFEEINVAMIYWAMTVDVRAVGDPFATVSQDWGDRLYSSIRDSPTSVPQPDRTGSITMWTLQFATRVSYLSNDSVTAKVYPEMMQTLAGTERQIHSQIHCYLN